MMNSPLTRRQMIRSLVGGSLTMPAILAHLLAQDARGNTPAADSLAPKSPHFSGKAKRVIFLYMSGGVSHLDTFDPKPKLFADGGKRLGTRTLLRPNCDFRRRGKCRTELRDLFPHVAACGDDICLI